jgi:hypothetical protein
VLRRSRARARSGVACGAHPQPTDATSQQGAAGERGAACDDGAGPSRPSDEVRARLPRRAHVARAAFSRFAPH